MPAEQKVTRKLRAILSADVKGYSTLMTNDEVSTIQTLKEYRNIMSEIISDHSGNVVDMPGDNIMAEFSSVVNAVKSSVAIQKALKSKNDNLPSDKRLEFRIGINIGDVVQDGDSLYGEGVNIAARIEGLADPGGICISRGAYDHIRNKLNFGYEYIGEHSVKNIKNPVRVYKILMAPEDAGKLIGEEQKPLLKTLAWSSVIIASIILIAYMFIQKPETPEFEPASVERMAHPLPDKPSIAVLAFDNLSGDPEQEFFSDGISEEIITSLSKSDKLFVISRNSSFIYKGKPVNVKKISEELGVRYVLEGSVRKSENKLRITAQLIDAISGHHLWAERYDRDLKDIFALQDEITFKIVTALQVNLTEGEQARVFAKGSNNLDVLLKVMEVRSLWAKGKPEDIIRIGRVAQEIIDMAPDSTAGYVHLAWYYWGLGGGGKSPKESFGKAIELAHKALSIEPDAQAHSALCGIYVMMRKYEKAISEGKKSVELEPNGAWHHIVLGRTLGYAGRLEEALDHIQQGIRLNPLPDYWQLTALGRCYIQKGDYEKALTAHKKALQLNPDTGLVYASLAVNYVLLGRQEEAETAAEKFLERVPSFTLKQYPKGRPYKNPADLKLFVDALRKAGIPDSPSLQLPEKPSIAVLAFDNMTGDSTLEYFSDGIAEEIINVLSNAKELFVIARNSSFSYKGKSVKVQQVSKELGVRYVLEGSVRKSDNKVRVTAQLIDATNGQHLWSKNYDRNFDNIFEIQDDISMEVVTNLRVELTEGEQARMYQGKNKNPEVYKRQLQGLSLWRESTRESLIRHAQLAKEIIEIAPESEIGYRALGWNHWDLANRGESPRENRTKALELALKAISIDDTNGFSHGLLCSVYMSIKEFEKAIASGKKSIELLPNAAMVHFILGQALMYAGRLDEAIFYIKQSSRLYGLPPWYHYFHLGICYMLKEQHEDALSEFKKAVKSRKRLGGGIHLYLAVNYIYLDRMEEARASAAKALELWPNLSVSFISKISKFKNQAHTQYLTDAMSKAGFPE